MKRIVITLALLVVCGVSVFAEEAKADTTKTKAKISWFYGGKVAFNTFKYNYSIGTDSYSQRINTFGISPKGGFFINDNMLVGLALWYNTQTQLLPVFATSIKELEDYLNSIQDPSTTVNTLTFAPHFRYRVAAIWEKRIGIWGEFRPAFSMEWIKSSAFTNTIPSYQYGVRLGPVITINVTPKMIVETSLDLFAIAWKGSSINSVVEYDEGKVHKTLPVNYHDSDLGVSYGLNFNSLLNAVFSIGIMKRF